MMYRYNEFDERRVVIYARVSTEHEAQISALSNQLEWYQQYLDHHPEWNLIDRYIDEGITGTSAEKRPGFTQMIEDAKAHKFDLIITREVSRFARNTEETLHFTKMLRRIGVEVFFINDNIKTFDGDGELRLTIMASLAQDESRKTSIRVKSGQQISMEKGVFYGNGNILGYDRVEKIVEGNKKQVDFLINPVQAETVRRIFDMYLEGHGLMAIKNEMERTGRKTATGLSNWHCTGISQTLKNSFYCGIITYHKEYTPDFLVQKKVKNYGEMALTQVQGRHEPIITVEEYERVQKIMKNKTGKLKNPTTGRKLTGVTPPKNVWGRLMICSCGRRFNRRKWRTNANGEKFFGYQCYGTTQTGTIKSRLKRGLPIDGICQSPMIAEWKLQMMANYIFRHFLTNKQKVLEIANSILEEHIGDTEVQVQDNSKLIEQKQRELDRANTKRRNLVDLLSNCDISREDYQEARAEVDRQIDKLKAEIEELTPVVEPTEEEEIDYESKITVLRYALEQYTNFDTDGDIPESVIEAFVEKIEVSKDCFKWYLRGDFGGDSPIPMNVEGNRKKGATISPQYIIPPANFGDSGCYQRKQIIADFIKSNEPPPSFRWGFCYNIFLFTEGCSIIFWGDEMYKYETHLHTFPVSRCAKAGVQESLEFYKKLGYDGVFITNHFLDGNINIEKEKSYKDKIEFYFSDYEKGIEIGKTLGIKVFCGVELSYCGTDFLVYGLDKEWFLSHPEIMDMKKSDELTYMMNNGALIIQAHPYREASYIDHIRLFPRNIHGVEIVNAGRTDAENNMAKVFAKNYDLIEFAGSDNHDASKKKKLAGVCCEKPICNIEDFINKVKGKKMKIFTFINE